MLGYNYYDLLSRLINKGGHGTNHQMPICANKLIMFHKKIVVKAVAYINPTCNEQHRYLSIFVILTKNQLNDRLSGQISNLSKQYRMKTNI